MKLPKIDLGYGPAEWHRDRHVVWTVFLTYLITRLPQIKSFNAHDFQQDCLTLGTLVVVTLAKSWLTDNTPPK